MIKVLEQDRNEHWQRLSIPLRRLCKSLQTGPFGSQLSADEYIEGGTPVINPSNLRNGRIEADQSCTVDAATRQRLIHHVLAEGDLVFARRGEMGRCALVTRNEAGWLCGTGSIRVRLECDAANPTFLIYVLSTPWVKDWLSFASVGSTMENLNASILGRLPVQAPPREKQHNIVMFLARETARIDTLIAKQAEFLTRLDEHRHALVTHAVTRGLDASAQTHESGKPNLGIVASAWTVKKLKQVLSHIEQGWSPQCENRVAEPGEWGVLKVGCVNGSRFKDDENKALPADLNPRSSLEVRPGEVLMSRANTVELVGSISLVEKIQPQLMLCDKLYRLKFDYSQVDPRFMVYCLASPIGRQPLEAAATGASPSMKNISQDALKEVWLAFPSLVEQREIADFLDERHDAVSRMQNTVLQAIDRLRERRSALITAAVTGQIDVTEPVLTEAAA